MNLLAFCLLLVSAVVFGIEFVRGKALVTLGLCLLSAALLIQFCATHHTVTF